MQQNNFQVVIRMKPLSDINNKQQRGPSAIVYHDDKLLRIEDAENCKQQGYMKIKEFEFDEIIDERSNNKEIFDKSLKDNIYNFIMGFNTCILAYGITGSGKTHTIFGSGEEDGIASLSVNYIYDQIKQLNGFLEISFFEVYNEQIRDLLAEDQEHCLFMYDSKNGTQIIGINSIQIQCLSQMQELISRGNQKRVLAQTLWNQSSSRSHAILQINIKYRDQDSNKFISPKMYIVDLAGSEKVYFEQKIDKNQIEGSNINKSLLALGNCLNILSDKSKKNQFIPYRNSKLTRILKDALGGNTRTILISCISQSRCHYDETLNTLTYSKRANQITRKVYREINKEMAINFESVKKFSSTQNDTNFLKVNESQGILKEEYLEKIYQDIFSNIEEFYEITQSLYELQNIVTQNQHQIELIYHKNLYNRWSSLDEDPSYNLLLNQQHENQAIENRLQETLRVNLNQKEILKNLLFKLCGESREFQDRLIAHVASLAMENQKLKVVNSMKVISLSIQCQAKEQCAKDQIIQQQLNTIENLRSKIRNLQSQPVVDQDNSYPSSFASSKSTSIQPIKRTNQQKLASISKDQNEDNLKAPNNQQAYLGDLFSKSKFSSLKILLNSKKLNKSDMNDESYLRRDIRSNVRKESLKSLERSRENSPLFSQSGFLKKKESPSMKKQMRQRKKPLVAKIELYSVQISGASSKKQSVVIPSINITEMFQFEFSKKSE